MSVSHNIIRIYSKRTNKLKREQLVPTTAYTTTFIRCMIEDISLAKHYIRIEEIVSSDITSKYIDDDGHLINCPIPVEHNDNISDIKG